MLDSCGFGENLEDKLRDVFDGLNFVCGPLSYGVDDFVVDDRRLVFTIAAHHDYCYERPVVTNWADQVFAALSAADLGLSFRRYSIFFDPDKQAHVFEYGFTMVD